MRAKEIINESQQTTDARSLLDFVEDSLIEIVEENDDSTVEPTSQASAPNTATFRASVGGMVELVKRYRSPGGDYSFSENYVIGIKVGGGVSADVHADIKYQIDEMWDDLMDRLTQYDEGGAIENNNIHTTAGTLRVSEAGGTNFTVYGIVRS